MDAHVLAQMSAALALYAYLGFGALRLHAFALGLVDTEHAVRLQQRLMYLAAGTVIAQHWI
jgi:hypothetical protein